MQIKDSSVLTPRDTDEVFDISPDTGHPLCICSRCKSRIQELETCIRVLTTNDKGEVDENSKEYRYCEQCTTGVKYFFCDNENGEFIMERCSKQCDACIKETPEWAR